MPARTHFAVGLDAGSDNIRCVVCALEGRRIRVIGCSEMRSEGWQRGRIADQQAAAESIFAAAQEAVTKQAAADIVSRVVKDKQGAESSVAAKPAKSDGAKSDGGKSDETKSAGGKSAADIIERIMRDKMKKLKR